MNARWSSVCASCSPLPHPLRDSRRSGRTRRRTRRGLSRSKTACSWKCWTGVARGPALVLLAGVGGTAHHYDDFAPALTAALSRGGSDTAQRIEDRQRPPRATDSRAWLKMSCASSTPWASATRSWSAIHSREKRCTSWVLATPRRSGAWCMSMRRSIVETTLTTRPIVRRRDRCPLLPVPKEATWRPSRLCVRIWRNTAALGPRRTCGPGTARILTEASLACGRRTFRSVKR